MSIRDLIEHLRIIATGEDLFEMANMQPDETGLKYVIWVSQRGTAKHYARIKVFPEGPSNKRVYFSVSVVDEPRVVYKSKKIKSIPQRHVNKVFEFVKENKDVLQQYWSDLDMSTKSLLNQIEPV